MASTIFTLLAEKGGVGRTTTTINSAAVLAESGYRILAVDTDKQGSLTQFYLGSKTFDNFPKQNTVAALFDGRLDPEPEDVIHKTSTPGIFVLPACRMLKEHVQLDEQRLRETQFELRDFLDDVAEAFDIVLIDTPPDIDSLPAWAALLASHFVVTPVEPETFSAQSLRGGELVITAAMNENPRLRFLGYFLNQKHQRRASHNVYEQRLRQYHNDQVFETVLRCLAPFADSQAEQKSVIEAEPRSPAAAQARSFVEELLRRVQRAGVTLQPHTTGRNAA